MIITRRSRFHRRAFTLVELLIVFFVISLLTTLTIAGIREARLMARDYKTTQHMQSILTDMAKVGQGEGSAAFIIQRDAGLNGVLLWRQSRKGKADEWVEDRLRSFGGGNLDRHERLFGDNASFVGDARVTSRSNFRSQTLPDLDYWTVRKASDPFSEKGRSMNWLSVNMGLSDPVAGGQDDGSAPYLRFPWGRLPPENLLDPQKLKDGTAVIRPDVFLLRHCSPYKTRELLQSVGIISSPTGVNQYSMYMTDGVSSGQRSPDHEWNDGWGRPLVVAFAMYQPPQNGPQVNANPTTNNIIVNGQDVVFQEADAQYKYTRSIYLSVAAIGPNCPEISPDHLISPNENHWIGQGGNLGFIWKRVAVGDPTQGQAPICSSGRWNEATSRWEGEWSEMSWTNPPWQGIRRDKRTVDGIAYRCFLSTPHEIK